MFPSGEQQEEQSRSSDDFDESEEEYSNLSGSEEEYEEEQTWIEWFCELKGNEYFVEVDEEFIRDDFNLTGLSGQVPYYDRALDVILDNEDDEDLSDDLHSMVEQAASLLYGLIHARFLLTTRGLHLMHEKYNKHQFGRCPNTICSNQAVLPIGLADQPNQQTAKLFCPRCNEVHHPPRNSKIGLIDGAYFGSTFPHLFFLQYDSLVPKCPHQFYKPRIYGFRVHTNFKDRLRSMCVQSPHTQSTNALSPSQSSLPPPNTNKIDDDADDNKPDNPGNSNSRSHAACSVNSQSHDRSLPINTAGGASSSPPSSSSSSLPSSIGMASAMNANAQTQTANQQNEISRSISAGSSSTTGASTTTQTAASARGSGAPRSK